ncbi:hypothetical protein Scep_025585 [Stephania cephalantha]|uniref:Uncharacterized protein n=1 Tax=Stephania cephalantha TaxID=152367 RepID=A0AAP0EIH3_9MAGN
MFEIFNLVLDLLALACIDEPVPFSIFGTSGAEMLLFFLFFAGFSGEGEGMLVFCCLDFVIVRVWEECAKTRMLMFGCFLGRYETQSG